MSSLTRIKCVCIESWGFELGNPNLHLTPGDIMDINVAENSRIVNLFDKSGKCWMLCQSESERNCFFDHFTPLAKYRDNQINSILNE